VAETEAGRPTGPEAFLEGSGLGLAVYRRVLELVPEAETRVTKSQIALRRRRGLAWLWRPRMYLGRRGAEIVLSIALPRWDPSPRWKEVTEPARGTWMHHLELSTVGQLDDEVAAWLREASEHAGGVS
jgi:hypothetical protein